MYALFSGGPSLHGPAIALGPYKLLVVPTDDTWTPEFHKIDDILHS